MVVHQLRVLPHVLSTGLHRVSKGLHSCIPTLEIYKTELQLFQSWFHNVRHMQKGKSCCNNLRQPPPKLCCKLVALCASGLNQRLADCTSAPLSQSEGYSGSMLCSVLWLLLLSCCFLTSWTVTLDPTDFGHCHCHTK